MNYLHFCSLSCIVFSILFYYIHPMALYLCFLCCSLLAPKKLKHLKQNVLQLITSYFLHFHSFYSVFKLNCSRTRLCKQLGGFAHCISVLYQEYCFRKYEVWDPHFFHLLNRVSCSWSVSPFTEAILTLPETAWSLIIFYDSILQFVVSFTFHFRF